jgi:hypothetical protein
MATLEQTNQTQFSAEQPFFESPVGLPQDEVVAKPVVPFFKRRKTILSIIAITTVVLLVVLFGVNYIIERNRRLHTPPEVSIATPTPEPTNSLVEAVEQLRLELKQADPTQQQLQVPALDMTIRLDEKSR